MSTHDRVAPLVVIAPSAGKTGPVPTSVASPHHRRGRARPPESVDARSLEDVVTDLARLTAQVRQMSSANHALRGANQTLTDANTGLRHDRADAQAETAHAHAETVDAQAETAHAHAETVDAQTDTADIRTRNVALQATNDAMDRRTADLEATVAEVERANGALQAHRVGVQELAAVLEAERAQFAVILAGLEDAVLVMDHTGTPLRRNAAYVHLFGDAVLAPDDARGRPLAPDQTPQARAARGETFSLSFSMATGVPSLTGEDTRRWFVATGQPLHEEGATHAIVVIRDVTLSNRHRRLQEEFLSLAGHELRTPLTSVKGYLDLLMPLLHAGSDERSRRYATRALHQTQALVTLVRDLTDAARLQGGALSLDLATLDLVPLVAQVAETAQALPAGHAIHLDLGAVPAWVHGDAGRLEQVLFNLLTNASAHAPSARAIDVRLRRVGVEAALEVQDYGRGIAADQLPHLFTRFYQVARADRPAQGGLGLGLFLCEQLVAAHGGRITVASTEGHGTTFTVWLPLLEDEGSTCAGRDVCPCR